MIGDLVVKEFIKVKENCTYWEDAIKVGAALLEEKDVVEKRYKEAIINNFKELGPYMVIAPGIVLSHARPESGVNETGISLVTLKNPINFGSEQNDPVKLIVTLAAKDNTSHLDLLSNLMEIFMNNEDLNKIFEADSEEEILEVLKKYKKN
ncbi:PTS sugar transporter subunit IIA [Clostridium fallax]|uniref:Ascorbate-specific PTS system EIIA component n=1 Tax=Clostridium fallax TaxID=1533 RepID=A0A1M4YCA4_9CLOT|nr:PTS sugar transporter subunit IIA [Clostridium fallax]SHF03238.1 PTS system IIA component, L-Asc family [Clostridium fallax]SQB05859.1 phosphotransferase system mannitol/fructose-specific IIA domain [Clostridium fallax]